MQQGDVLRAVTSLPVLGLDGAEGLECPHGVVLISQTCDLVLPRTSTVQVAPVVELPEVEAREAALDLRPRFAHLPRLGERSFADLDVIATLRKTAVARALPAVRTLEEDDEVRRFGRRVVRKAARFAFPDEVVDHLQPLVRVLGRKARRAGAEGRLLGSVSQLRIECAGLWSTRPWSLTLVVVLAPGVLPLISDDAVPQVSPAVREWIDAPAEPRTAAEVAARLVGPVSRVDDIAFLWQALADAWAATCAAAPGGGEAAAVTLAAEVLGEDEMPVTRYLSSEQLDLDHLSSPRQR